MPTIGRNVLHFDEMSHERRYAPRAGSNGRTRFRKPLLYPLSYGLFGLVERKLPLADLSSLAPSRSASAGTCGRASTLLPGKERSQSDGLEVVIVLAGSAIA
jgi:hypothetical protein